MSYSQTDLQLTHLLQRVYRRLKTVKVSKATGGSTTTIADTNLLTLLGDNNEDDFLNNWSVIVIKDSAGAGAAPEGEFNRISDYTASTGTITVPDVFTAAVASGDKYMYISPEFPLFDTIEIVNDALVSLGNVIAYDTSITTAANQTEYTLPLKLKGQKLLGLEIQGITTDGNDNRWIPIPMAQEILAAAGSTGTLILPQYASGYQVRIRYFGLHPRVDAFADYINERVHPEVAVSVCVAHLLQWYNGQTNGNNKFMMQREDRAWNQLEIAKSLYPVVLEPEQIQGFTGMNSYLPVDEFASIPSS